MIQLQTERLALRDFRRDDLDSLFDLYARPETSEFESWDPHQSIDESRDLLDYWIARQIDDPRTDYTLALDLDGTLIGLCGLELGFGTETDDLRSGFVGFRVQPAHWNQGFASEALRCSITFGFEYLHLHRIHSGCAVSNAASVKVLEKAGLTREGTTRSSFPIGSRWVDYAIYGILESEWRHIT
ncbi:MAG: GNAT family N-acetyltransferase [Pseudomonadales bacterium]|nr:GNAT family N-acetyltransferase [Pseudomonadales bacterium]